MTLTGKLELLLQFDHMVKEATVSHEKTTRAPQGRPRQRLAFDGHDDRHELVRRRAVCIRLGAAVRRRKRAANVTTVVFAERRTQSLVERAVDGVSASAVGETYDVAFSLIHLRLTDCGPDDEGPAARHAWLDR